VERELRDKLGHNQIFAQENRTHSHAEGQHGMDSASHKKHTSMVSAISDCQILLCSGIGMGACQSLNQLGIQPIVTDIQNIEEAFHAYPDNQLIDKI